MVPVKKNGKTILKCTQCGYEMEVQEKKIVEKKESKKVVPKGMKEMPSVLPKVKVKCPKCGNTEAYTWTVQTRAADEPPTRFYKCTKCGYVWREYE